MQSASRIKPVRSCAVDGCDGVAKTRGWCVKHYARWVRHGDPTAIAVRHNWAGDTPTYRAMHKRIAHHRGAASRQDCIDCGGCAAHWSFVGVTATALRSPEGRAYSINIDDYRPRCVSCHKKLDDPHPVGLAYRWAGRT